MSKKRGFVIYNLISCIFINLSYFFALLCYNPTTSLLMKGIPVDSKYFTYGGLGLLCYNIFTYVTMHGFTKKNKLNKQPVSVSIKVEPLKESPKAKDSDGEIASFRAKIKDNCIKLDNCIDDIKNYYVRDSIKKVEDLLNSIAKNANEKNFNRGNLAKLNTYYIPTYLKIVESYANLDDYPDLENVKDTLRKLETTIYNCEEVFKNILSESLGDEILDISAEAKVLEQISVQNGVFADGNVLYLKR